MTISVDAIDAILPQTQCGECGFPGCKPYAEALSQGAAPIDRCPPGGVVVLQALAQILNQDATPYMEEVAKKTRPPAVALINEADCIGCTKCIPACPVDAIMGSAKLMHTVLSDECTGCGLCIEPCPMDCISLLPLDAPFYDKNLARTRFNDAKIRRNDKETPIPKAMTSTSKETYILEALARVRDKKNE